MRIILTPLRLKKQFFFDKIFQIKIYLAMKIIITIFNQLVKLIGLII